MPWHRRRRATPRSLGNPHRPEGLRRHGPPSSFQLLNDGRYRLVAAPRMRLRGARNEGRQGPRPNLSMVGDRGIMPCGSRIMQAGSPESSIHRVAPCCR